MLKTTTSQPIFVVGGLLADEQPHAQHPNARYR